MNAWIHQRGLTLVELMVALTIGLGIVQLGTADNLYYRQNWHLAKGPLLFAVLSFGPPLAIGRLLKDRVRAGTGLAVSVGIAPAKMVAKIASDLAKPDGLLEVAPDRVEEFLRPLPVGRLWGVGPVTEATLNCPYWLSEQPFPGSPT